MNFTPNFEVANLAYGGCSNAMIALQLSQGLALNPDFVIVCFTNEHRYELDKDASALPRDLTALELANYQKNRYTTNMYDINNKEIDRWMLGHCSDNLEKIKNYFYICFCLFVLKQKNIPFAFSLGGFEYQQDYAALINSNYMCNFIRDYADNEIKTNLWFYGNKSRPYFHVDDENVQTLFANECISRINDLKEQTC